MRSNFMILIVATAVLLTTQQFGFAQYVWAPVAYGQPLVPPTLTTVPYAFPGGHVGTIPSPTAYSGYVGDSSAYTGFVGDLRDSKGQCDARACDAKGGAAGCDCSACGYRAIASRLFGSFEYLHWWNHGRRLPALVSTSPQGTPQNQAGVLPEAQVLFGDGRVGDDLQAAGRLTVGMWLDDCRSLGVGARIFGVEGDSSGFFASSDGNPILTRPFFNDDPLVNGEDSLLVAYPAFTQGNIGMTAENDVFGGDVFLRYMIDTGCASRGCAYTVDVIAGYHFTRIDDDLLITTFIDDGAATFDFLDLFDVSNEFHGGELGVLGEIHRGCWTLGALGKISVGNMRQRVAISGENTVTAGGSVTTAGGLLAQPTNIGVYQRDVTVWAPEATLKLSYAVSDRLSISIGYTLLYWTRVALAGDQVDRHVNASQLNGGALVGAATPAFAFRDTDFWVQTVDVGFAWNY